MHACMYASVCACMHVFIHVCMYRSDACHVRIALYVMQCLGACRYVICVGMHVMYAAHTCACHESVFGAMSVFINAHMHHITLHYCT